MEFDILGSSIAFSKRAQSPSSVSIIFDVAPSENGRLDLGDEHVVCSSREIRHRHEGRKRVGATVQVSSNFETLAELGIKKPCSGVAFFAGQHEGTFDFEPASLSMAIFVEPEILTELLKAVASSQGGKIDVGIEDLGYGHDPDGPHQIWKLPPEPDFSSDRRLIRYFSYRAETLWTSEGALRRQGQERRTIEMEDSGDPEERALAKSLREAEAVANPVETLLRQCRALLWALLIVGVVLLIFSMYSAA